MSTEALQRCLDAEHAAVYGYGVLGGTLVRVSAPDAADRAVAAGGYAEHRHRRDELIDRIAARGLDPVAAKTAYDVEALDTLAKCRRFAQRLEARCAETYAAAVAASVDGDRGVAARALTICALRGAAWGAPAEPFPGVAEV